MDAPLLVKVGVVVAVLAVLWVMLEWDRCRDRALRVGRALHLVKPPPEQPCEPPLSA